jgi:hypothetical protein
MLSRGDIDGRRNIGRGYPAGFPRFSAELPDNLLIQQRSAQVGRGSVIQLRPMRAIRFLPLVFIIGIDGFVMFAPYVILLLSFAYLHRRMRAEPEPILIRAA